MTTRKETDSLGSIDLPEQVYYGIQTARAIENFPISGLRLPRSLLVAYLYIKLAAAKVHGELKVLDKKIVQAITKAAKEALAGKFDDDFVVDVFQAGAGTSYNMNVNEVLANRACEILGSKKGDIGLVSPNDHVNRGQSTNDTFPTAMRIAAIFLLPELSASLDDLIASLAKKAKEFSHVIKSGRTHLQDAVPMTLGQEFQAYVSMLGKTRERIFDGFGSLFCLNLGATAIGTGVNTHPLYAKKVVKELSRLLEIELENPEDFIEITQNMADFVSAAGALKILAIDLTKLANDLRLLSSGPGTGLNEIILPAVQPGSSIMPGKVNPVMAEMLNMVAFQVMGNENTITLAAQAGQLELNVMMPLIAKNLLESMEILTNSMKVFAKKCVDGIIANQERCLELAEKSLSIVTPLATKIGYLKAAEVVKKALQENTTIPEMVVRMGILSKEECAKLLDLEKMLGENYK